LIRNDFLELFYLFGVQVLTIGVEIVETGDVFGAFGFKQSDFLEQVVFSFSEFFLVLNVHPARKFFEFVLRVFKLLFKLPNFICEFCILLGKTLDLLFQKRQSFMFHVFDLAHLLLVFLLQGVVLLQQLVVLFLELVVFLVDVVDLPARIVSFLC
jgi:hypothetical protein